MSRDWEEVVRLMVIWPFVPFIFLAELRPERLRGVPLSV
jgi:hypothetical protein